jgi:hypothetical protein
MGFTQKKEGILAIPGKRIGHKLQPETEAAVKQFYYENSQVCAGKEYHAVCTESGK